MNPAIDENDLSDIWDLSPTITPETTHAPGNGESASHSQTQTSHAPSEGDMEIQHPRQSSQAHARFHQTDASDIYSDLPSLRRTHINTGYRDGLTTGKTRVIQQGFDAGFPIGVEIALRVGRVLGVLEGVVGALRGGGGKVDGGWRRGAGRSGDDFGRSGKGLGKRASNGKPKSNFEVDEGTSGDADGHEGNPNLPSTDRGGWDKEGDGQAASTKPIEARRSEMERLLTRAREELSITALLDGLDEDALAKADTLADLERIEKVIAQWERIVLGCSGPTAQTMLGDKNGVREETKLPPSPDETQA